MKVAPEVGQIWVAQPHGLSPAALTAGLFSWKRFVRIEAVDVKHDKIRISTVWTPERDEALRRLHAEGLSASQIAIELDCGLTRNAVIGRTHRLGLSRAARPKPEKTRPRPRQAGGDYTIAGRINRKLKQDPMRPPAPPVESPAELPAEAVPRRQQRRPKQFFELKESDCRYPYGEQSFLFCAAEALPNRSYCGEHFALCCPGIAAKSNRAE
jgi:GcrA cell cycle regulator